MSDAITYRLDESEYIRETEKAYLVKVTTIHGEIIETWFPKSQADISDGRLYCSEYFLLDIKEPDIGEELLKTKVG